MSFGTMVECILIGLGVGFIFRISDIYNAVRDVRASRRHQRETERLVKAGLERELKEDWARRTGFDLDGHAERVDKAKNGFGNRRSKE